MSLSLCVGIPWREKLRRKPSKFGRRGADVVTVPRHRVDVTRPVGSVKRDPLLLFFWTVPDLMERVRQRRRDVLEVGVDALEEAHEQDQRDEVTLDRL